MQRSGLWFGGLPCGTYLCSLVYVCQYSAGGIYPYLTSMSLAVNYEFLLRRWASVTIAYWF